MLIKQLISKLRCPRKSTNTYEHIGTISNTPGKVGGELTLAILKPDICCNPIQKDEIIDIIKDSGLSIVDSKSLKMTINDAKRFYAAHEGRFFYPRLVNFMSSGPMTLLILSGDNCISRWRQLMGPTKVCRAIYDDPESIRARFGITDTRNVTHGSDSPETAISEIKFFFPEFQFERLKSNKHDYKT